MILDRIQNRSLYAKLGSSVAEALEYLATTDFSEMSNGKHELDGDRLFIVVQRYRPKPLAEIAWEAHRDYVDVQYVVNGAERMGYSPLSDALLVKQPYDPQRDVIFYELQDDVFSLFPVSAGSFAVFAPQDVHAPALAIGSPEPEGEVLKVVAKCHV